MSKRPIARPFLLLIAIAALSASVSGCAARVDRFSEFRVVETRGDAIAPPPDVRRGEMTGRSGYATFGSHVRLRDDTPPLTRVIEAERLASNANRGEEPGIEAGEGPTGPQGSYGRCDPAPYGVAPWGGGPYGSGLYGSNYGPVGAIPLGLRTPYGADVPAPVFTRPAYATPGSDVWHHRPGLSTGSGIYARRDSR